MKKINYNTPPYGSIRPIEKKRYNRLKGFIIRHMKTIMGLVFTVCMGGFFYLLNSLIITHQIAESDRHRMWIILSLLGSVSALAIVVASIFAITEDRRKAREHRKHMEAMDAQIISYGLPTDRYHKPQKKYDWYQRLISWLYRRANLPND